MLAKLLGVERATCILEKLGLRQLAWNVAAKAEHHKLCDDPTYSYTFDSAVRSIELAELALKVKGASFAHEWAILDAASALWVLQWKGELDSNEARRAEIVLERASAYSSPERVAELLSGVTKAATKHNTRDELWFKQNLAHEKIWVWQRAVKSFPVRKLEDRPE